MKMLQKERKEGIYEIMKKKKIKQALGTFAFSRLIKFCFDVTRNESIASGIENLWVDAAGTWFRQPIISQIINSVCNLQFRPSPPL
jgi:hypothetical protein